MTGWNLPPGCTVAQVNDAFGDPLAEKISEEGWDCDGCDRPGEWHQDLGAVWPRLRGQPGWYCRSCDIARTFEDELDAKRESDRD